MMYAYRTEYNSWAGIEYVVEIRAFASTRAFEEHREKWRNETWHLIKVSNEKP